MKLLGLSGGSDSLALFYMLLEDETPFEVAHLDHGWREESHSEAEKLREIVESKGIEFHCKRVKIEAKEDVARKERHRFFKELTEEYGFEAVLLAHHADDQAETVLKRVFEGGDLSSLQGMKEVQVIDGLQVERPILGLWKKDLILYLEEKNVVPFYDASNADTKYLRARMREHLLPFLNEKFGKNVQPALERLHGDSAELADYLDDEMEPYFSNGILDFSSHIPHPFILKALLRKFCRQHELTPRREPVERAARLIEEGALDKSVTIGKKALRVHKSTVSLLKLN